MFKNINALFLTGVFVAVLLMAPVSSHQASAAYITDQEIENQEEVAREAAEDAVRQYLRLTLYMIIMRLGERLDN